VIAYRLQAVYYIATGAWAVLHRPSFERITGPKTDYWLVRTVGLLAVAIGAALSVGSRRAGPARETAVLAVGTGVAFAATDAVYVTRGRIRRVYLADTATHVALACLAAASHRARR
jgi:hypothetical protein